MNGAKHLRGDVMIMESVTKAAQVRVSPAESAHSFLEDIGDAIAQSNVLLMLFYHN